MAANWWHEQSDGFLLYLKVIPNAKTTEIIMLAPLADRPRLLLRVNAIADKGKANQAVLAYLAKALDVTKSSLSLVNGDKNRNKTVFVKAMLPVTRLNELLKS